MFQVGCAVPCVKIFLSCWHVTSRKLVLLQLLTFSEDFAGEILTRFSPFFQYKIREAKENIMRHEKGKRKKKKEQSTKRHSWSEQKTTTKTLSHQ